MHQFTFLDNKNIHFVCISSLTSVVAEVIASQMWYFQIVFSDWRITDYWCVVGIIIEMINYASIRKKFAISSPRNISCLIVVWSIAEQYYCISNISVHNCVRSVNTMTPYNIKTSTCRTNICWIWTVFYMLLLIQHNNKKKQKTYTIKPVSCDQDLSERSSADTSVRGPEKPERCLWISEWPNSLSHRRFILIVFHSLGYVQLLLDMLSGHSAAQEIKHLWKFAVVLLNLKSSILREVWACFRGHKAVLFRLAKYILEVFHVIFQWNVEITLIIGLINMKCTMKGN